MCAYSTRVLIGFSVTVLRTTVSALWRLGGSALAVRLSRLERLGAG